MPHLSHIRETLRNDHAPAFSYAWLEPEGYKKLPPFWAWLWETDLPALEHPHLSPEGAEALWRDIALLCPHASEKRPGATAYTPTPEHGQQDRQVISTDKKILTKALLAHNIPSHVIDKIWRMWEARSIPAMTILTDPEDIETAMENGPSSCMRNPGPETHPYAVYSASLGWALAVWGDPAAPSARALVRPPVEDAPGEYVTIYGADQETLRAALDAGGYQPKSGWHGHRLEVIEEEDGYLMPYVDGGASYVKLWGGTWVLVCGGDYEARSTSGILETHEGQIQIHGGDWIGEEDAVEIDGEWFDRNECSVCEHCCEWVHDTRGLHDGGEACSDCCERICATGTRAHGGVYLNDDVCTAVVRVLADGSVVLGRYPEYETVGLEESIRGCTRVAEGIDGIVELTDPDTGKPSAYWALECQSWEDSEGRWWANTDACEVTVEGEGFHPSWPPSGETLAQQEDGRWAPIGWTPEPTSSDIGPFARVKEATC